jgi:hypothetical protein
MVKEMAAITAAATGCTRANSENRRTPMAAAEIRSDRPTSFPVDLDGWAAKATMVTALPARAREQTVNAVTR